MPRSPCLCVCVCVRRGGMLQGTEGKFSPPSKAADKWQGRCAKERGEEGSRRMRKEGRGRRGRRGSGTAPAVGAASPGGMERLPPPTPGEAPPACRGWERVPLRLRGGGPAVGSGPCRAAGVGGDTGCPTSRELLQAPPAEHPAASFPRGLPSNASRSGFGSYTPSDGTGAFPGNPPVRSS